MIMTTCKKLIYKKTPIKENPPIQAVQAEKEDPLMITYLEVCRRDKDPQWLRQKIYLYSQSYSVAQTAKEYGCHINTVKKIRKRGKTGEFGSRSRAPKHSPNCIDDHVVEKILDCREDKGMGPRNLKHQYEIPVSVSTIYRTLKRHNQIQPRRKKWKQSRDLRRIKQRYRAFEHLQVDGKCLTDIPEFYDYLKILGLPTWQFTVTCQKTGASFISYSKTETMNDGCTFVVYVLEHLKKFGIDTKNIRIKTDRGGYAIGSMRTLKKSKFIRLIETTYKAKHQANQHKNQNADVERFHGLVEEYFYKRVRCNSKADFFRKAFDSIIWFNYMRKNSGKNWKTPIEILKEDYPNIDPQILSLPPIYLPKHLDMYFYKIDPFYKPLAREDFLEDSKYFAHYPQRRKDLEDHFQYCFGDAKKSSFLKGAPKTCGFGTRCHET